MPVMLSDENVQGMEGTEAQTPLVCPGHTRGVVQVSYSNPTPDGVFLISACLDAKVFLFSLEYACNEH
jgi:hypothetical protein